MCLENFSRLFLKYLLEKFLNVFFLFLATLSPRSPTFSGNKILISEFRRQILRKAPRSNRKAPVCYIHILYITSFKLLRACEKCRGRATGNKPIFVSTFPR